MEHAAQILLVLTLVMPGQLPDKHYKIHMDSIEECFAQAKAFVDNGVTAAMTKDGVIAVAGACSTDRKKEDGET